MTETFSQWTQQVNGQAVDVEPGYGAQCYGLMKSYMNNVVGVPGEISTQYGPYPGFAINTFTGYQQAGLAPYFEQLGPGTQLQAGDVVFWPWGASNAPESHVAIANGDGQFWSQNSPQKYTTLQGLESDNIAGVLRPLNQSGLGIVNSGNGTTSTDNSVNGQPVSDTTSQPPSNPVFGLLGLGFVQNLIAHLFMPSTWIRLLSGWLALVLFVLGIIFIILDYRKAGHAES